MRYEDIVQKDMNKFKIRLKYLSFFSVNLQQYKIWCLDFLMCLSKSFKNWTIEVYSNVEKLQDHGKILLMEETIHGFV